MYDPATGTIEVYFRLPSLSASADQTFYFVYSDPAVTDLPRLAACAGAIRSGRNYKGVYHFHGGFSTDASGSVAHGLLSGPTLTRGRRRERAEFRGRQRTSSSRVGDLAGSRSRTTRGR